MHARASSSDASGASSSDGYTPPAAAELDALVDEAVVWAAQHGLVVGLGQSDTPAAAIIHAPLAALPVAFPRARFLQAKSVQPLFNRLVDRVASDEAYLERVLTAAARQDSFTARLLQLLHDSRPARQAQTELVLGIHRSDYMLDSPSGGFLQVELNTIASSFGCLSAKVSALHQHMATRVNALPSTATTPSQRLDPTRLPPNPALEALPAALAAAVQAHAAQAGQAAGTEGGVVLMVVQPGERNAYDQQWLQHQLWVQHGVRTVRRSLAQIAAQGQLDPATRQLTLVAPPGAADGPDSGANATGPVIPTTAATPVAVVYFRAGYTPADYPSEREWGARLLVEQSSAVKCPSVAYQLAGAKKVQQDLAGPGVLELFMGPQAAAGETAAGAPAAGGRDDAAALRVFFAGLWALDDLQAPETAAVVADALQRPEAYVLKPQREGGGNNLYGEELVAMLQEAMQGNEGVRGLPAYILMQRILPPPQSSVLVRQGAWQEVDSLSELGVYGTFLRRGDTVLLNAEAGHLVRTKAATSNEGGVAAGFAVLDSPYLVD